MFLFLSDYLGVLLCVGYLLLLISVVVLIMIAQYHTKQVRHLNNQVDYWQQQALSAKHHDEYRKKYWALRVEDREEEA